MMSQREHGLEPAGEGVGRSGPAEACASAEGWRGGAGRRSQEELRFGLYREAVSFNASID